MEGTDFKNWLYNGRDIKDGVADLGYFIGYAICRSYYKQAADKQKAVKDILELNFLEKRKISNFLRKSKYKGSSGW